jgi:hypothetical protein
VAMPIKAASERETRKLRNAQHAAALPAKMSYAFDGQSERCGIWPDLQQQENVVAVLGSWLLTRHAARRVVGDGISHVAMRGHTGWWW